MNPYAIIVTLALGIAGVAGAGWGGFRLGVEHQKSAEADRDQAIREAVDLAGQRAAQAINKIRVVNTTIQNEVQHETRTHTVYIDCRHTPDGLRLVNAALAGGPAQPAAAGQLSSPDTPAR